MTDVRIEMGQIVAPHGIRGEVKITPLCKCANFATYAPFYDVNGNKLNVQVKRFCKNQIIAMVNDVRDRNAAENLRGTKLFINRSALPDLKANEYYVCDLIGMDVFESGTKIGNVAGTLNYGAGDILQIKNGNEELLLSMNPATILNVDLTARQIEVAIPEMVEGEEDES